MATELNSLSIWLPTGKRRENLGEHKNGQSIHLLRVPCDRAELTAFVLKSRFQNTFSDRIGGYRTHRWLTARLSLEYHAHTHATRYRYRREPNGGVVLFGSVDCRASGIGEAPAENRL